MINMMALSMYGNYVFQTHFDMQKIKGRKVPALILRFVESKKLILGDNAQMPVSITLRLNVGWFYQYWF